MNILLCGVGGQGTVLASRLLAMAAMESGLYAMTAETIGMAQRGGSVVSHVRYGSEQELFSPLIPEGEADLILGFEPGETVRNLGFLKEGGSVIVADRAAFAVTDPSYDGTEALDYLKQNTCCTVIETQPLFAQTGSEKVLNVALIGAASEKVGLQKSAIEAALAKKVKPQFLELNRSALAYGAAVSGSEETNHE